MRLAVAPEQEAVDAQSAVDQALAELSPRHRRAVALSVWDPREPGARDVTREVSAAFPGEEPMMENNVHQVLSRWRKRLRVLLRGDTGAA